MSPTYRWFVNRDLDGFFGLFVDNLVQLLLILTFCGSLCGMSGENSYLVFQKILPGAGISILIGNLFYSWQAHRLARQSGRSDVTALPYGINTPSLIVFVFFVMAPTYEKTHDAVAAWQMGLVACLGSGIIELAGCLIAGWIRRNTPRAALLATLAGIAIGFISMTFALRIWQFPLVAMVPMAFVLVSYFSGIRFPWGIPGGFLAVVAGTVIAWILPSDWSGLQLSAAALRTAWGETTLVLPQWAGGALWQALVSHPKELLGHLSVVIPMGLFNVIGSLQNIESAEAAGDSYPTAPSLAANGIGTIAAALFGSCFPTTIYIGHPGWKEMGARSGYSVLNGFVITVLCLTGAVAFVSRLIPIEAGIAIVLWIGVVITAQAYQATPREHAPAVAIGLFPAIAAWGATVAAGSLVAARGATLEEILRSSTTAEVNGFLVHGLNILERGYIFTCMIVAAITAFLIDRRFLSAAVWSLVAALFSWLGLMHAYKVTGNVVDYYFAWSEPAETGFHANGIAAGYFLMAILFGTLVLVRAQSDQRARHA